MASRDVVAGQEQPKVKGGGKQKKNGQAAEGKTRRVLRDIGNLVPVVDGEQQITRRITRGFKTQLLANAQKETDKNNKKKPSVPPCQSLPEEVVNDIVARDNGDADAAAHKKDADKPNPGKVVRVANAKPDNGENKIKKDADKPNPEKVVMEAAAKPDNEENKCKKVADADKPNPEKVVVVAAKAKPDNGENKCKKDADVYKPKPEKVVMVAAKAKPDNGENMCEKEAGADEKPNPEKVVMVAAKAEPDNGESKCKKDADADEPNPEKVVMVAEAKPDNGESKCNKSGKSIRKPSKKPGKSLTSVLTARSEAICKLKKEIIVDIDVPDIDNELAAVEYIGDIYEFYKLTEEDGRVGNYMDSQPEINIRMRAILVDWLIEVHKKFDLMPESLYLTVNIMDRYLSMKTVSRKQLQLVGISSMLIATKYEEIWAPEVSEFIGVSDNTYARDQILMTEKAILGKLGWYLTVPTPYVFLVRYIKASVPNDPEIEHMVFFFAELGLMDYSTTIKYSPSKLAASAVYAARCTLNKLPCWNETLKHHTGYSEDQVMDCAKLLVSLHSGAAESKLKGAYRKYSSPQWSSVALFPPATTLLSPSSS